MVGDNKGRVRGAGGRNGALVKGESFQGTSHSIVIHHHVVPSPLHHHVVPSPLRSSAFVDSHSCLCCSVFPIRGLQLSVDVAFSLPQPLLQYFPLHVFLSG